MTILLGDKSPIEQDAIGAISQKSHLLLLGATADFQEPEFLSPFIYGVCVGERAHKCTETKRIGNYSMLSLWDN